ncbi:MAG: hypothetical protein M1820_002214 [Bogoriella megaspora]|nr:MAG: hypothetical protein M1820_002214 [Bogoriella megaspora]
MLPDLLWTPEIERDIAIWQQTGQFPFPELQVLSQLHWASFPRDDLRLLYHISQVSRDLMASKSSNLSIWTEYMPRFLNLATSEPFVMSALLGFSATHMAWITQSHGTKGLAFHHGGIALNGLHDAIGVFARENSDVVLAASLLLSWQANDWHGWSSLMTGIKTVIINMQPWKQESIFADYLMTQDLTSYQVLDHDSGTPVTQEMRQHHLATLQSIYTSLQRLLPYVAGQEQLTSWTGQLQSYIQRLQSSSPAQTAEQQFGYLYVLRKWLLWVPPLLLGSQQRDFSSLLVLAYFYTTALALEPLFPDIAAAFCANLALGPLDEIFRIADALQANQSFASNTQAATTIMEFPRETASNYKARIIWRRQQLEPAALESMQQESSQGFDAFSFDLNLFNQSNIGSLSPAFAPSPLTLSPAHTGPGERSPSAYYLDIPVTYPGLSAPYSVTTGGSSNYSSPSASTTFPRESEVPSQDYSEGAYGSYGRAGYLSAPPSGFVPAPSTMWV